MEYLHFLNLLTEVLSKHAPLKKKFLRTPYKYCSRLRNKLLHNKQKLYGKDTKKQNFLQKKSFAGS